VERSGWERNGWEVRLSMGKRDIGRVVGHFGWRDICRVLLFFDPNSRQKTMTCRSALLPRSGSCAAIAALMAVLTLTLVEPAAAGTWTALAHRAPGSIGTMLLLSDGTVMAQQAGISTGWYRLTPDTNGSYVTGTWSTLAAMNSTRLYYSSQVLTNGRVFVAGAEYGTGWDTAEVYDPVSNTWTQVTVPPDLLDTNNVVQSNGQNTAGFLDMVSEILANGEVLMAPVEPAYCAETVIYDPNTNTCAVGPTLLNACNEDEASWVKLPDNSILTVDPFGTESERYIPSLNGWVNDATVPVSLWNANYELGAALLLPTGQAFYLGGNGHTVLYTPSGSSSPGAWTTGPNIPGGLGINDAPAAMMVNGSVLCAVGSATTYNPPTSFYEYNPFSNSFAQVSGPTGTTLNWNPFDTRMLDLPDGSVLFSWDNTQLYEYRPNGAALAAGAPAISDIVQNPDGSYLLTGTLLNGISEGAAYGDDAQMNSNYPIIRMTAANGQVYFARSYGWSSTGVMTGTNLVTTEFVVSAGMPAGTYAVVVVANGISSLPFALSIPPVPQPPGSLTAIAASLSEIDLAWTASSNATGYIVNRDGSPIATTSTNTYSDPGLEMGTGYCYTVAATNSSGVSSNSMMACATTFPATTNANLLAWWTFDEGSGSIAFDYSGNDNTGTVVIGEGQWTNGVINGALAFDGDSTRVTVSNSASLNPINGITVAAWVNNTNTEWIAGWRIVEKGASDNQYGLLFDGSSNLEFLVAGATNGTVSTVPPGVSAWHHVAGTYDGTLISLYIDGQLATQQVASGSMPIATDQLAIGSQPGTNSATVFDGLIDDVRIYGSALTPAGIAQLYNTDSVGDGIPNWWREQYFGVSSATDATDCAACDFDGTGQNNQFKYVAGLDPTNPISVFVLSITSVTNPPSSVAMMYGPWTGGRTYMVQFSTDLVSGVWLPLGTYAGPVTNLDQITATDTNAVLPQEFYRIDISLP